MALVLSTWIPVLDAIGDMGTKMVPHRASAPQSDLDIATMIEGMDPFQPTYAARFHDRDMSPRGDLGLSGWYQ